MFKYEIKAVMYASINKLVKSTGPFTTIKTLISLEVKDVENYEEVEIDLNTPSATTSKGESFMISHYSVAIPSVIRVCTFRFVWHN